MAVRHDNARGQRAGAVGKGPQPVIPRSAEQRRGDNGPLTWLEIPFGQP